MTYQIKMISIDFANQATYLGIPIDDIWISFDFWARDIEVSLTRYNHIFGERTVYSCRVFRCSWRCLFVFCIPRLLFAFLHFDTVSLVSLIGPSKTETESPKPVMGHRLNGQ